MQSQTLDTQLSNLQLELLKLYSRNISEADLAEIRELLSQFFAKKATRLADIAWDEKGLTAESISKEHQRLPYKNRPIE